MAWAHDSVHSSDKSCCRIDRVGSTVVDDTSINQLHIAIAPDHDWYSYSWRLVGAIDNLAQGCTTYFTNSARNISGREMGAAVGVWGLCPQWGPGQSKRRGKRCRPEADDDLLIQQLNFCAHSYVYAEIQLQLSRPDLFWHATATQPM